MTEFVIPEQLHNWRFILLCPRSKIPTSEMNGWAEDRQNKTFTYDSAELRSHFEKGGNYAVITDKDRFVLAADTACEQFEDRIASRWYV